MGMILSIRVVCNSQMLSVIFFTGGMKINKPWVGINTELLTSIAVRVISSYRPQTTWLYTI